MYGILLFFHVVFGSISLIAATLAMFSAKGMRLHRQAGKIFFAGMVGIFVTAIPMSLLKPNVFLFLIAIFSFYLAFAGMRFAINKKGIPKRIDWLAVCLLFCTGVGMLFLGVNYFMSDDTQFVTLFVFALIALLISYVDFSTFKKRAAIGKKRISRHLTCMLAGTIAVVTAVLVTNIDIEPTWIAWILPTITITPAIVWWNRKVMG